MFVLTLIFDGHTSVLPISHALRVNSGAVATSVSCPWAIDFFLYAINLLLLFKWNHEQKPFWRN